MSQRTLERSSGGGTDSEDVLSRKKVGSELRSMVEVPRHKAAFLLVFLAGWSAYFGLLGLLGLLGFQTRYGDIWLAIIYQFMFVALVSLPVLALPTALIKRNSKPASSTVVAVGIILSVVSILCLFIGKIMSGVDYGAGACIARNQMIEIAKHRNGASPTNVIGYLFGLSFFVSTAVIITQDTTRKVFWITIAASFACLMALSEVAASRSTIMLYLAFVAAAVAIRFIIGRRISRIRKIDIMIGAALIMVAAGFVLAMFNCRAVASGVTTKTYMNDFAPFLGAQDTQNIKRAETGGASDRPISAAYNRAVGLLGMTALYATHSAFTFAGIVGMPPDDGHVIFVYPMMLMARAGIVDMPNGDWELAGRFTSLPGGMFHDFRLSGLVLGSILLGVTIWFGIWLARTMPDNVIVLGVLAALITTAILSPIHSAFDFLGFPFFCFSFVIVPIIAYVIDRRWPQFGASK